MRKFIGTLCIVLGMICLISSACLIAYNHRDEKNAGLISQQLLKDARDAMKEESAVKDSGEMPTVSLDGYDCIGILSLPTLGIELPVLTDWSYEKLKSAPCLYYGSYYAPDFVIAGHNYSAHLGRLSELQPGDRVLFTDVTGKLYSYKVELKETLPMRAVPEMTESGFDLSLYTCTIGGESRLTVRCRAVNN